MADVMLIRIFHNPLSFQIHTIRQSSISKLLYVSSSLQGNVQSQPSTHIPYLLLFQNYRIITTAGDNGPVRAASLGPLIPAQHRLTMFT